MSQGEACAKVGKESVEIQVLMPYSQQTASCADSIKSVLCSCSVFLSDVKSGKILAPDMSIKNRKYAQRWNILTSYWYISYQCICWPIMSAQKCPKDAGWFKNNMFVYQRALTSKNKKQLSAYHRLFKKHNYSCEKHPCVCLEILTLCQPQSWGEYHRVSLRL